MARTTGNGEIARRATGRSAAHLLLAAVAFAWICCVRGWADADPDGTYLAAFDAMGNPVQVDRAAPIEWRRLAATDCLRLERRGRDEIFFEIVVNEASGHSCSATGTARRQPGEAEFAAELETFGDEGTACRVRLRLLPTEIELEGLNHECRIFCGAGAVLEARFAATDKLASSIPCEVSPVPDLDALERAAERGLRDLEEKERPGSDAEESDSSRAGGSSSGDDAR